MSADIRVSDTPRTDAIAYCDRIDDAEQSVAALEIARSLERSLIEHKALLREVQKYMEHPKSCELYRLVLETSCGPCSCGLAALLARLKERV